MNRGLIDLLEPPFCPSTNETGGEDDQFFSFLQASGGQIVWTDKTHVFEDVDDHRMNASYIATRSFAFGQGASRLCVPPNPVNVIRLARLQIVGFAQIAIFGIFCVAARFVGAGQWIYFLRKMSEGAGKIFWFERFRPRLYGQAALKKNAKVNKVNSMRSMMHLFD